METFLFGLAAVSLACVLVVSIMVVAGSRKIVKLSEAELASSDALPSLSVVVAARNEARNIEAALESLLKLEYEPMELIVVNDRSTDATGGILQRMAATHPHLKVAAIDELPDRWLGKNHALHVGASQAGGDYLLFTDADVVMAPDAAALAVRYARRQGLDHLTVAPSITMPNWLLESFVVTFTLFFSIFLRPWKVTDPRSKTFVGIGAFNLLRSEAYRQIGGMAPIAMRPDDDIKLGKLVKQHGLRQEMVNGIDLIRVPWYESVSELVVGLEKNTFAAVEYRVSAVVFATLAMLAVDVWPFVALFVTSGPTWWLNLAIAAMLIGLSLSTAMMLRARLSCALGFPLAVLIFIFIQWRTMLLTYINNGIRWRDTRYALKDLKANRI